MDSILEMGVGQIVATDYRNSLIFKKYGIDFCCCGNKNLSEACAQKNINLDIVLEELGIIKENNYSQKMNYHTWSLDILVDHIEQKHHRYVKETVPILEQNLNIICESQGKRHQELYKIKQLFSDSTKELISNMKKEEAILFPFIREMVCKLLYENSAANSSDMAIKDTIDIMWEEHKDIGNIFRKISDLSDSYAPPEDASCTYKATYELLREFEEDLHLHTHLENNILFPKTKSLKTYL